MQEIIHAFGIDWRLIAIQVFNFGVLAGVLWYFLYTPVLKILAEREEKIKKGILDAEEAGTRMAEAETEKNAILKSAHGEATLIVGRAAQHAEAKGQQILSEMSYKASRELTRAQTEAAQIKEKALKESEAEIAKLAILGAERVLNTELSK